MNKGMTRRSFLGGTIAMGALSFVSRRLGGNAAPPSSSPVAPAPSPIDPRVAELVALSRDGAGVAHVERAAFVGADGVAAGTLSLSAEESRELLVSLVIGDFTTWQERGLRVDGRKFVFIRDDAEGTVVHAVRPGEFLTLRATADLVVIATTGAGMIHNRAVEAVYRFTRNLPAPRARNA